ncbi:MAG TPA: gamma carbonic anhydrase family protein [Steroidobacteraceae bacterium]|jgi:carbonic anhydrase/acetyltransferase-like protein (isoleucine patch superfamily)
MSIRPFRDWAPETGPRAWVDPAATVIGRVAIGEDSSIWPGAVLRGDVNFIRIGARTSIQDGSVLHVASDRLAGEGGIPLLVGDDCTVGHGVILHACTVGDRCLVGMGAVVMDGAVLGDEVIVGAGALVPAGKRLPPRTLWVGSPARQSRRLTDQEIAYLKESAAHYVALKDEYLRAARLARAARARP